MTDEKPDKKKPEPRRPGWLRTLGEVALAIGLVPVFLAALVGVGQFLVVPLFNEVIEPILNAVFAWLGHIAREWGFGWALAAFIVIWMIIRAVVGVIHGLRRREADTKESDLK